MIPVQPPAVFFVLWIKLGYETPKTTTVISVDHVADFMNNYIIDYLVRGHDQFAVKTKSIGG